MAYREKEGSREVLLVGYYNVLFYLMFRVGLDEYKKDIFIDRINSGEKMMMKDIYGWCQSQKIPVRTKFLYRKDYCITANLWNLYSYCRFKFDIMNHFKVSGRDV